jgi:hypothetical protein
MAKKTTDPDPAPTSADTPPAAADPAPSKRDALEDVLDAIDPLKREDQREILRAAAAYYGLVLSVETVR